MEMAEILIDKAGSGNGFKPGVLYCFDRYLKGPVCSKCLSHERCEKEQEREKDIDPINMSEKEIEVVMGALSGTPTITTSDFANKVEKILREYEGEGVK